MEDLFLLIGTNPLPNFISVKHFLETEPNLKKIWFIYSKENKFQSSTRFYADNIKRLLEKDFTAKTVSFKFIELEDIENARMIRNDLKNCIDTSSLNNVHLNITGGTKVMGIFSYLYFQDLRHCEKSFSYLSPKLFCLIDENGKFLTNDLRDTIKLTVADVLNLHGYNYKSKDKGKLIGTPPSIEEVLENNNLDNRGRWFERLIMEELEKNFNAELYKNLEIWRGDDFKNYFEIDALFFRGYQLFCFSLTTLNDNKKIISDKKTCKMKGFEVLLRTNQIGGDEAKAVLITLADAKHVNLVRDELFYETGGKKKILVLGYDDFKYNNYIDSIKYFLDL